MVPLTHALVGTVIYQELRKSRLQRWSWVLAFPLAFFSHHFLDAIPHFEKIGPLIPYRGTVWTFAVLGMIGAGLAAYVFRRNRRAGLIWLALSFWIGLGGPSAHVFRLLTALAFLGLIFYVTRKASAAACLLAGMLAVSADFVPQSFRSFGQFHDSMHYATDWGTSLYRSSNQLPLPAGWQSRLQNPYFLFGYGLELLVEGFLFLGALYLFTRPEAEKRATAERVAEIAEPVELAEGS